MADFSIETFSVGYLSTNCYLVSDGKIAVVVDPGGGFDKINNRVAERNLTGVAVLLTHGHFDHIMALSNFQKAGYRVFIHEKDEKMLKNEGNLHDLVGLGPLPEVPADGVLSDGQELRFGEMIFRVLHTPGHTEGSVCYDLDEKYLFSGDTLFRHFHGRTDFPGGNDEEMTSSLQKIFALPGDREVFPGHDRRTVLSEERAFFADWL